MCIRDSIYPGPRDIFATQIREPTRAVIGPRIDKLAADHGHIVVRVPPGGREFTVYVLGEGEGYPVLAVHGPYLTGLATGLATGLESAP